MTGPSSKPAVEHRLQNDQPGPQIAAELGIRYPGLKDWKRRHRGDAVPMRAHRVAESRALTTEPARVRAQREILKKVCGSLGHGVP